MIISALNSGKTSLILDFATIPVLPSEMCVGNSCGANILPMTFSSSAAMSVITQ